MIQLQLFNYENQELQDKPEYCECCNKIPDQWVAHYSNKNQFKGWICNNCKQACDFVNNSYDDAVKLFNYLY